MSNEKSWLQAKDIFKEELSKLQATHHQCTTLQKTVEYNKSVILEGVWKWLLMGEVTFAKIEMECLNIENLIDATKQEIQLLEVEEKVVEG